MSGGTVFVVAVLLGLIPASIARGKGGGFWVFWILGSALFIVALPMALLMKDHRPTCPYCAEVVKPAALVCPHCQRVFAPS